MTTTSRRTMMIVAAAGALGVLGGGVASAAPSTSAPVPGTNCSVGQVERALAKENPRVWQGIESRPEVRERFQEIIVLPPAQREQAVDRLQRQYPQEAQQIRQWRAQNPGQAEALVKRVSDTCARY